MVREIELVRVADVVVANRLRPVGGEQVNTIAASMREIGLQSPILIRYAEEMIVDGREMCGVPVLVAGAHRLAAAKQLGWERIEAVDIAGDDVDARLAEIAENLHRSELTVQERAEHVAEWVRLTSGRIGAACTNSSKPGPKGAIREAERALGMEHTAVNRAIKIASLTDEAKEAAREAGLDDNQSALLAAAKAGPERQAEVVREIAAAKADRRGKREANTAYDKMTKEDATDQLASILSDHIPGEHWNTLTALLYAAGCKDVARAFNRLNGAPVFDNTNAGRA